jgi:hypothetical protein
VDCSRHVRVLAACCLCGVGAVAAQDIVCRLLGAFDLVHVLQYIAVVDCLSSLGCASNTIVCPTYVIGGWPQRGLCLVVELYTTSYIKAL